MKRQPKQWGKHFAKLLSDKSFKKVNIQKFYKELIRLREVQTIAKTPQTLIKKWAEKLHRHFPKEDIQLANRCPTSLIIRQMQIKTTARYHVKPIRMPSVKKTRDNACRGTGGEMGTLLHYW